ncbi:MAG: nitroreductase family protein [Butyrivibrio sp.]|nr:nitroreductase family protein [Butyrivibrio sp.]
MATVLETIAKRSSTRGYAATALTEDEINKLIHAGLQAPTGANKQELHFTVLKGDAPILAEIEAEKNALRNLDHVEHNFYYEAPTLIIISADADYKWSKVDSGIAVENIALASEEMGLGNLIIGCIYDTLHGEKRKYFEEKLAFPENYEFEIAIAVGHKAVTKEPHTYDYDKQVTFLN